MIAIVIHDTWLNEVILGCSLLFWVSLALGVHTIYSRRGFETRDANKYHFHKFKPFKRVERLRRICLGMLIVAVGVPVLILIGTTITNSGSCTLTDNSEYSVPINWRD